MLVSDLTWSIVFFVVALTGLFVSIFVTDKSVASSTDETTPVTVTAARLWFDDEDDDDDLFDF